MCPPRPLREPAISTVCLTYVEACRTIEGWRAPLLFDSFAANSGVIQRQATVSSIILRLSRSLPDAAAEALDEPHYSDLAARVADLVGAGRIEELRKFFGALEAAYTSWKPPGEEITLYEGFMESLIYCLRDSRVSSSQVYEYLQTESRNVWEDCWRYIQGSPWSGGEIGSE